MKKTLPPVNRPLPNNLGKLNEQLDSSNARFQTIFDTAAVGIGMMGLDRKLIDANPALCRMFGYSREELVGKTPVVVTYADDYPASTQQFNQLMTGKELYYWGERRYQRKNGEVFWANITMSVVRDSNGKPLYLVGILEDIDKQKKAIAELQQSEARFRTIFENASLGIALVGLDGLALAVNPAIVKMTGYSEHELLSMPGLAMSHPDDRLTGEQLMRGLLDGKQDMLQIESRFIRKDGQEYWVRQRISLVGGPEGKPAYIMVMVEDIDEQKRVQAELNASESHFRAVFDNSAIGISLIGLDRKPLAINQALVTMTGFKLEEMMQKTGRDFSYPDDVEIGSQEFWDVVNGIRNAYQIEKRFLKKDGSVYWGRLSVSGVRDTTGQLQYLVAMTEDITSQKITAEKLAVQEADYLQELSARVEERTQALTSANLQLVKEIEQRQRAEEVLASKAAEEAILAERTRLARDLHDAVTQTLFSASLIAEVLPELWEINPDEARKSNEELRQLTRGALAEMRTLLLELRPATLTQARLPALIKQLSEALIGRARLPVNLVVEGEDELPLEVKVAFYRVAQESLNNIIKYSRAHQVDIMIRLRPGNARLEIKDDGVGFNPVNIKPTSLGMRIMRERVDAVGGNMRVASAPGKGTSIIVSWKEGKPNRATLSTS